MASKARNIEDAYPLSPTQEGMLFHSLSAESQSEIYVTQVSCTLSRLDIAAFERAWQEVVRRQPILRTVFAWKSGKQPIQVVGRRVEIPLVHEDWTALDAAEQERRWQRLLVDDHRLGFDLSQAPLSRLTLIRVNDLDHRLIWTHPHILLDGWSFALVLQEVSTLYQAFSQGLEPRMPSRRPYRDYIAWLQQQDMTAAESFWRKSLEGLAQPTPLVMAEDKARPGSRRPEEAGESTHLRLKVSVDVSTTVRLEEFARRHRLTLNTLLRGAWGLLLARYSGERDIVFGATVAGRPPRLPGVESMVGLFINTLPVRQQVDPRARLLSWLEDLQAGQLAAQLYEYTPLAKIRGWSGLSAGTPLFESILVFENYPEAGNGDGSGLAISDVSSRESTDLPLTLVAARQRQLTLRLDYERQRLERATVAQILRHLTALLRGMAEQPDRQLSEVPMLGATERHQLLAEWSDPVRSAPSETIIDRFTAQVARRGEAIALLFDHPVHGQLSISYRELAARSGRLARRLRRLGVGPEVAVGLFLERSPEMVVAILAVLEAGGGYVPLDPVYPQDRLAFMMADADLGVILTQRSLRDRLPADQARVIVCDDESSLGVDDGADRAAVPTGQAGPSNLAYIIYTSGSTGKPKGVPVPHGQVVRLLDETHRWFNFDRQDIWTLFHSYAFDFSVWELWGALAYGGRLAVVPHWISRSPESFYQLLGRQRVTVLNLTPSAFRQLVQAEEEAETRGSLEALSLRWVVFGGEALELHCLVPWFDRHGDDRPRMVNMYGITETTVHVTYRQIRRPDVDRGLGSVIGRPIPDLGIYLVDERLDPVPVGGRGEMYVSGAGLTRGYLKRPGLCAQRFFPHPFSRYPGERLYRTGDLARYGVEGELEYQGRADHQVKIRGFRIELGEIEAALLQHETVGEAVVLARPGSDGQQRLVAWVVSAAGKAAPAADLRRHLGRQLPEYMVPAAFVPLGSLPLTAHGKLDARSLPEPGPERPELEHDYAAPQTPEQETLCRIWAEVLAVEKVGIDDNFFALGGDSILSIRVCALALRSDLQVSIEQIFRMPSVRLLAAALTGAPADEGAAAEGAVDSPRGPFSQISGEDRARLPEGIEDAYPLAQLQAGMLFHSQYRPGAATYHDIFSYHLRAPFAADPLEAAARAVVARHAILRTSFQVQGFSQPLQCVHREVPLSLAVDDLRGLPAGEQEAALEAWIEAEKQRPFAWDEAPLIRFQVHRRSGDTLQFTVSFHHAILDGWSLASLLTELFEHYLFLLGRRDEALGPPPASTYSDFVALERRALEGSESREFWLERLADAPAAELPGWPREPVREVPDVKSRRAARLRVPIDGRVSEGLRALAESAGAPIKSVLLAAHLLALGLITGRGDVISGVVANSRFEGADGERVLGLFLNTLPLRLDLGAGSWRQLVRRTLDAEREVMPYRRHPLADLQKLTGGQPLFAAAFNFVHFHVYDNLLATGDIEPLDGRVHEETNFTLCAQFSFETDPYRVRLSLDFDGVELSSRQVGVWGELYARTLRAMAENVEGRYDACSALAPAQRQQLLVEWNDTVVRSARGGCVHQRFRSWAERTPEAVAIRYAGESIRYGELARRVDALTWRLVDRGVGPEVTVGVCMERSPELVVAILAVLEAGGAYLPLDPIYPEERWRFMASDARLGVVLTQESLRDRLSGLEAELICCDRPSKDPGEPVRSGPPRGRADSRHLAYVMYTSGSTGRPKGVGVEHAQIQRLLDETQSRFEFSAGDVWTLFHSYAFDFSVWELWGALTYGGTLVIVPHWVSRSPDAFYALVRDEGVTVLNQTPSAFRQLIRASEASDDDGALDLRWVIFGGEALDLPSLDPWFRRHGDRRPRLVNMYGITETTVHVTYREIDRQDVVSQAASVIGRPFSDRQIYLLDRHLMPVPAATPGEIFVAGGGVSRGYQRRPGLCAERFIPHSFSHVPGERLYRAGDLARYRPDGDLDYLGRIDHQVQVRGFRVELGEIEAALTRRPEVGEAVVLARGEGAETRLVAWLVAADPQVAPSIDALREALGHELPDYMVPAAFSLLDRLPLNAHGKLDRTALPEPGSDRPELETSYVAPETPEQQALCEVWSDVLGVERVGIEDNFFALGGDSILSIRIRAEAVERGLSFSLEQLFETPTIAGLIRDLATDPGVGEVDESAPTAPFSLITGADREALPEELEDAYPLARLQAGMLFHNALRPEDAVYHDIFGYHLRAPLDVEALGQAAEWVVDRHPVLRTSFHMSGFSEPLQWVHRNVDVELGVEDLTELSAAEQEIALKAWIDAEKSRGFAWEEAPLIRFQLHLRSAETFQLTVSFHHAILDGWSLASMLTELFERYLELLGRGRDTLAPVPASTFRDYVARERSTLESDAGRKLWRGMLADAEFTGLPRWPGAGEEGGAGKAVVPLPDDVAARLAALARRLGVPIKSVLLAAHLRVLSLLAGRSDVTTGLVSNGRPEGAGGERVLGLFLNTLPLRFDLAGPEVTEGSSFTWESLVKGIYERERQMLPWRRYPLAELQKLSGGEALFEVAFNFIHFHVYENLLATGEIEPLGGTAHEATNFPLTAHFSLRAEPYHLQLAFAYDARQLSARQVDEIGRYYLRALSALAEDPGGRHDTLTLLGPAARHQALVEWNDTAVAYGSEQSTLHSLVAAQMARTPDRVAVEFEGEALSFRQLDRQTKRLARRLRAFGVGPEVPVAVLCERSLELVVALLGVLRAGGAYVPLDPDYPADRLAFMTADAGAPVLLTQARLKDELPAYRGTRLFLDESPTGLAGSSAAAASSSPAGLGYAIYTSGSTGKPKGAMNSHRAIVNRLEWMQQAYGLAADDRVLQKTPFSFDVSVWEFFWPLITGSRLVMARPGGHRDNGYLVEVIRQRRVTTLHFVPSMLRHFLHHPEVSTCRSLRRVIASGEALTPDLEQRFFEALETSELHNLYGPTEAAVDVTFWACRAGHTAASIPIGRPIANLRTTVLDRAGSPVPAGVAGQLFLGGVGLGRGYLGRPALTAETFVPDPHGGAGERLYRTGDLSRQRLDGVIEFLGRLDHQVKVRGFRIELGEIETALTEHPAVREAVVMVRTASAGDERLVAWLVTGDERPGIRWLRQHLEQSLPGHMVPSHFVFLDTLPLTPNGKLDRRALPEPDAARPELDSAFTAPRTPLEATVVAIWSRLLGVDRVGVHDNFFELGGDSILCIQVVSQARREGLSLTPKQLFATPTVAGLATAVGHGPEIHAEQGIVEGSVPLTPIQRWFFEGAGDAAHHFNQSVLLRLKRPLDEARLRSAVEQLWHQHDALRSRFFERGGEWHQEIAAPGTEVPCEWRDLAEMPADEQSAAIELAAAKVQAGFDLTAGPLARFVLFDLGTERAQRLLVVIHHLAVDGVAWRILLEDFQVACEALPTAGLGALGPKTTSYKAWAGRLERHAQSPALAEELAHWNETLPATPAVDLPADFAGEAGLGTVATSATVTTTLDEAETRALLQDVSQAYRTRINDVLLTALVQAFASWTGRCQLHVDLEGHGREDIFDDVDLSRTVGWFTSLYPVALDLGSCDGPGEALMAIKEQLRGVPDHGLGYGLLRYLRGGQAESLARRAASPVIFNYLGQLDRVIAEDAWLEPAPESSGPAQAPATPRRYSLEVTGAVSDGRLRISFHFSEARHRRATVESLAQSYGESLRGLIAHCVSAEAGGRTPADFPRLDLDRKTLDQVLDAVSFGGDGRRRNIEDAYPLSPMQEGILFHSLYAAGSGLYVGQLGAMLEGLEHAAFQRAWQKVVGRHSVLRTAFVWEETGRPPVQVVGRAAVLPWIEEDWRGASPENREDRWQALRGSERSRGFDVRRAPLMRLVLIRWDDRQYRVLWTHHHVLTDGWSVAQLFQEVLAFYRAEATGREVELPPSRPYSDYIDWLGRRDAEAAETFWRRQLAGFTAPTDLGVDRPASGSASGEHLEETSWIDAVATARLRAFAQERGWTLNTVVQGAWTLLLSRYSGSREVLYGTVVSGRPPELEGIESMVGLFINTLPVRLSVPAEQPVGPWLDAMQLHQAELREYEHSPLARIREWSEVPKDLPLFESLLVFENYPVDQVLGERNGDLVVSKVDTWESTNYPLGVVVAAEDRIYLKIGFDPGRFDRSAVRRMLGQLQTLMTAVVDEPKARCGDLPLMSAAEQRQLAVEWNATATDYPRDATCADLFHEWVERTPEAVAVELGAERIGSPAIEILTYAGLASRARLVAHDLRSIGVGPDVAVGVAMERSSDLIVSLVAILEAGGYYVPLDPGLPEQRLRFMVADSGCRVVLVRHQTPAGAEGVEMLDLAAIEGDAGNPVARHRPKARRLPEQLVYAVYTSGSTGQPKAVAMSHRGLVRLLRDTDYARLDRRETFLQLAAIGFDVAGFEIWAALLNGGRLVLMPPGAYAAEGLLDVVQSTRVTSMATPAPLFHHLASEHPTGLRGLRQIFVGGDVLSPRLAREVVETLDDGTLINSYGPTENAVKTTTYTVSATADDEPVPIGAPIRNTWVGVFDHRLRPLPIGVPGELCAAGDGLARGYLGCPGLTAECFVPHPLAPSAGDRLYRTGDLSGWREDANLEFLGRIDHQVKVRGFRIELGEIEAVLSQHPGLREVVVLAPAVDGEGDRRLVAFAVPADRDSGLDTVELADRVRQSLPEYMVPAAFVILESLPRTANGKLDREALERLAPSAAEADDETSSSIAVGDFGPIEETVAGIWRQVLVDRLGREATSWRPSLSDDFFVHGGDSLLAMQVISRLRQALGIEVPMSMVFEAPTLGALGRALRGIQSVDREKTGSPLPPLVPAAHRSTGERPDLPLSFAQERLWFIDQLNPGDAAYHIPTALRLEGELDPSALAAAFTEIVRRHEVLRTTFTAQEGPPVQVIAPPSRVPMPVIDLSHVPADRRQSLTRHLAREEARQPFDLTYGPLLRLRLVRWQAADHVVLLTLHHVATDGWSMAILTAECSALYEALLQGRPSPLPDLSIQYADFARWQRQWLDDEVLAAEIEHWRGRLADLPSVLELPVDRRRPAVRGSAGAGRSLALPADVSSGLLRLADAHGATPFMVLLTAFEALLGRYTEQRTVAVGTPTAGRHRLETEGLVGFFVNTLVLGVDLADEPDFLTLLARVREVVLTAHAHQDVPFEKLVDELEPERSLSHTPLFQVLFAFQNVPMSDFELPGLRLSVMPVEATAAQFDLSLMMAEGDGRLGGTLTYSTELFDRATIDRLVGHYRRLLGEIVADPSRRVGDLPILSEAESAQLMRLGDADVGVELPAPTLHDLFARRAAETPQRVAVELGAEPSDSGVLTYGELRERAGILARHLRSRGVGPEVRVGLACERSPELVIGLLAILEAGGAYVPLDPGYPQDRLAYMFEDAGLALILTQSHLRRSLMEQLPGAADFVAIDALPETGEAIDLGAANTAPCVRPDHPAYVIYTSGSTGRPKGVVVSHRNVLRLFEAVDPWFEFGPDDVWTLFHSHAFDFSVWELWGALLYGGRLVVVPYFVSRSPQAFHGLLVQRGVTVLNQTPSAFRQLIRADEEADRDLALRYVIFGGEALDLESLAPWFGRHGDRRPRLINMYGITETTVHVTYRPVGLADLGGRSGSRIGRAIPDLGIRLYDHRLRPVPIGGRGELFVGGGGPARGYLRRPALTAERFLPDAGGGRPGERLYRTGDLGRLHAPREDAENGDVEYLGRIDRQIQVRGFRVEPGEIEAELAGHPGLREAAVLAVDGADGTTRLVAYVVPAAGAAPTVDELRAFLGDALPSYMVPSAFLTLDAMPLTANGKLDRRALPALGAERPELAPAFVGPRNPREKALAEIWGEVLSVDRVGILDNYFALGGDSILSIQVRARAARHGLDFSLEQLFQHPTIQDLVAAIDLGTEILEVIQTAPLDLVSAPDRERLPPEVEDAYPLARLQEGMLFHSEYSPGTAIYLDVFSYHLELPFDEAALRAALADLASRHPVLRTSFESAGLSQPLQWVWRQVEIPLGVDSLQHLASSRAQEEAVTVWIEQEKQCPFLWNQPPLLRCHTHLRGTESFQFTISFHHAILDGWSLASLLTELFQRYLYRLGRRRQAPAEPPAASYRDFVALEQSILENDANRQYWRRSLAGAGATRLPIWPRTDDLPLPLRDSRVVVEIGVEVSDRLKALADLAGAPVKNVLLAAHLRALSALTGDRDVVTGLVVNGRPEVEGGEKVLGLFLNTLPFRFTFESGTWLELVQAVFAAERGMMPFRRYPLAELRRHHDRATRFETLFNFVHFHVYQELAEGGGIEVRGRQGFQRTNYDLTAQFGLDPLSGHVHLELECPAEAVSQPQLEAMGEVYGRVLRAMAQEPSERVERCPVVGETLRRRMLRDWNRTALAVPRIPVPEMFAARAAATPEAPAVVSADRCWTYGELDRKSNRWARRLRRLGVGPGSRVGLALERSPEQPLAVLAVWKAGGAWVPLHPHQGARRMANILEDAGVNVLLTQSSLLDAVRSATPVGRDLELALLDRQAEIGEAADGEAPGWPIDPSDLAYVIYTSGSTGEPKGVQVPHAAVTNLVAALGLAAYPDDGRSLKVSVNAPMIFDASVKQLVQLAAGHCLRIVPEELRIDGEALLEFLASAEIEVFDCTPSQLRLLLDAGLARRRDLSLRRVLIGGEAIDTALWRELCQAEREIREASPETGVDEPLFINVYGPTECTVDATVLALVESIEPSIGTPIGGVQAHVLDRHLAMLPVAATGELILGGAGLAWGYLGRPARTALSFAPDSLGDTPGGRLYRTGDLACHRPDGLIVYRGRVDHQVKIRGRRIELGEIEAALASHSRVKQAAADLRPSTAHRSATERLVVWWVPEDEGSLDDRRLPTQAQLRTHLKTWLGDAVLPNALVAVEALPLLPSGKVDRRSLTEPAAGAEEELINAPRTAVEEILAGIWEDVLETRPVAADSDFFELGGHSLLATRVVSRIRQAFAIELPLRTLFEAPTVETLARRVEAARRRRGEAEPPPMVPVPRDGQLPLSFAQQRLWFIDSLDPGQAFYNSAMAVQLSGRLDVAVLGATLDELVRRHETLRTTFPEADGRPLQAIAEPSPYGLLVVDLTRLAEDRRLQEARKLATQEARRPFDLGLGPLFRFTLLRLGEAEHVALLAMHHIISDAWSTAVFVREVATLYDAFARGQASPLPALPLQYADFAAWQRNWLEGDGTERLLSYWKRRLAGELPVLELPLDRPRPAVRSTHGGQLYVPLAPEVASAIRSFSRRQGATPFMTLLAGFKTLLHRDGGQQDVIVGSAVANRNRVETENLIGFFINMLVLRTDLSGTPSFVELLGRIRETSLEAFAHQDLPFERLVEELAPERQAGSTPLFQVAFGLQNAPEEEVRLKDLQLSRFEGGHEAARFDLTLWMLEIGEGLAALWTYSHDVFERSTIERMHSRYETLLRDAMARPETEIDLLEITTDSEKEQRESTRKERKQSQRQKLKRIRPKAMKVPLA